MPTLALGIPGSNSAAIMLAALILHGIQPGPFLLSRHGQLVYTLFAGLILVNLLMIPVGLVILRLCLLALRLSTPALVAAVLVLCMIGTDAAELHMVNPWMALAFGMIYLLDLLDLLDLLLQPRPPHGGAGRTPIADHGDPHLLDRGRPRVPTRPDRARRRRTNRTAAGGAMA